MTVRSDGRHREVLEEPSREILVVEDSRTFSTALSHLLELETGIPVRTCGSLRELRAALEAGGAGFTVAVVDLTLPDAPHGEALDVTIAAGIATLVFTASFDPRTRDRIMKRDVVDYVLKDNQFALDTIVASVRRTILNRSVRVLVVDDMASSRMLLARMLRLQQYVVLEAGSGRDALAVIEADRSIQLVVIDYNMPDMDGFALTRQIRRRFKSQMVRVIGVSSSSDRIVSAAFLKAGADDFISRPFIPEELNCRMASNAETLRQIGRLRDIASTDYLTSLHNRRHFFDTAPRLAAESAAKQRPSAVSLLDVDHFKRLNDLHGHEVGDLVLVAVARCLSSFVEGTDQVLARIGGEEFAIMWPDADLPSAARVAEEIRGAVERVRIAAGGERLSVTVSIGVAAIGEEDDFDHYLNVADKRLYAAKNAGRNRVCSDWDVVVPAVR